MHARVVTGHLRQGSHDQFVELFRSELLQAVQDDQGFVHLYMMTDPGSNEVVAVTLYEKEGDAVASQPRFRERAAKAAELFSEGPNARLLEVRIEA